MHKVVLASAIGVSAFGVGLIASNLYGQLSYRKRALKLVEALASESLLETEAQFFVDAISSEPARIQIFRSEIKSGS